MAPPPGFWTDGEDIHNMMQSYALTPSSQKPSIRQLAPPLAPLVQELVQHQGYPEIVNRKERSPFEVVIRLEGPSLTHHDIRSAFMLAERQRALPWTGTLPGSLNLQVWEGPDDTISPLSRHRGRRRVRGPIEEEDPELEPRNDDEQQEKERLDERARRKMNPSYILGFEKQAEAQAFVRYWHRRSLELPDFEYKNGDIAPVVSAEILW